MRTLGCFVVVLTLVLGAGGVATRPLAEEAASAQVAPTAPADLPAPSEDKISCRAPTGSPRTPGAVAVDVSRLVKSRPGVISLNTRGYNYRNPGDAPVIIPDSTGNSRPEGLPKPQ